MEPIKKQGTSTVIPDEKIIMSGPLTHEQMQAGADKRVHLITKEFSEGFAFLEGYPRSVSVFGSARVAENDPYYKKAVSLTHRIASELQYSVITGGGPGIMEAANRGAFEAKGNSIGITIRLPHEQVTNPYLTDKIALTYFFARKVCLSFSAEAYIFFPGGFGTLDEFFEILTLVQTEKISSVPIILVGADYWKPLEKFILEGPLKHQMISETDPGLFVIEDNEDKILEIIRNAPTRDWVEYQHGA